MPTLLAAVLLFAHAGHVHNFLGTVKTADAQHLVITTEHGKQAEFKLTTNTRYMRNGAKAKNADLVRGLRVSVYVEDDGKTAKMVSLAR